MDQCRIRVSGPSASSSSCATSQTVTTSSGSSVTSPSDRVRRGPRSRPARSAASIAPEWTAAAGCVPALDAGTSWAAFQAAAASCDRAEFAVHTNRTWRASSVATGSAIAARASGSSRR